MELNTHIYGQVKQSGAVHIVLDCQLEKLRTVLKDAQVQETTVFQHQHLCNISPQFG